MKPKEQTKPTEDKSNNKSKATIIFDDLINKRKKTMSKWYDSVDYNNLKFEHVGPTKDVSFYEYMDSKELFNTIKNNRIKFSEVKKQHHDFLKRLNEVHIGEKTDKQKEVIIILKNFTFLEKLLTFLETILKCYLMLSTMQNKMKLKE